MNYQLVIFDMDGTLVQSENCASQALIDVIPALNDSVDSVTARYKGMRLADIFRDIESKTTEAIPENCLELYREREEVLSQSMIHPSIDVNEMLGRLRGEKCIASNAPVEKTMRSLQICGLQHHFPTGIFSAYEVQAWKPDPALFKHAAKVYEVDPANCLVIEDSEVGVRAALSAGMTPVFYNPHGSEGVPQPVKTIENLVEILDIQNAS